MPLAELTWFQLDAVAVVMADEAMLLEIPMLVEPVEPVGILEQVATVASAVALILPVMAVVMPEQVVVVVVHHL
jgi:hypothetical protein